MDKKTVLICSSIGAVVGAYLPVWLFKVSEFSVWSIIGGIAGGLVGIWLAVKLNDYF